MQKKQNRTLPTSNVVYYRLAFRHSFATDISRAKEQAYWWEGLKTFWRRQKEIIRHYDTYV